MHIDRERLTDLLQAERERFVAAHPRSETMSTRAHRSLLGGVPMNWMARWPGPFPLFVAEATAGRFVDIDGHDYVDFCLGDTGAMTGHAPTATVQAIHAQAAHGLTTMLPTDDSVWVAEELTRRFGLPLWQFALSATDANRFALRLARHATGRPKIAVFDWCYHGTVDETLAVLDGDRVIARPGSAGPPIDPALTTKVMEFNDLDSVRRALEPGDVACVLAEPALTNIGIVLPEQGFHDALREITRATGTLLVIDETHTICAGPGGCTAQHGLAPDLFVIGKPIGGGVPAAAFGMTREVAAQVDDAMHGDDTDVSGIGGTLAANPLSLAAVRATLSTCLRAEDFAVAEPLAERWAEGVAGAIAESGLPWSVQRLGCRAEYWFCPPPRTGAEAAAAADHELDAFMHLHALNRGVLLTPFHNMALLAPSHTSADVDRHTASFREALAALRP
jgi:glutamate-1-semialdehyde 2,1-aminomutase